MSNRSVGEVAEHFEEFATQVVQDGEPLVVTRDGQPFVEVRPVQPAQKARTFGEFVERLSELQERLGREELAAFARDVEEGRRALNALPQPDPWES